jgi:TRAP-type C4-dicarboxylate transport system substrate-binding protein
VAIALMGFTATASADEWRIATLAPQGSTWMKILDKGAAEIADATDDRIALKYYPNGVQGDEKDVISKMKLGQLDGGAMTIVGLAEIDAHIRVLSLPMMFTSKAHMEYVVARMWPYFQKRFEKKGYMLGSYGFVGPIHFLANKKVQSVSDLKSLKVWQWGDDPVTGAMFKELGVNGVPLGVPEVLGGLTSGRINAAYGSPLAAVALQWNTKVKYMSELMLSYGLGATVVRKEIYNAASADDLKKQKDISKAQAKKLRRHVVKDNKNALKQMKNKGVTVVSAPQDFVDEMQAAAEKVWESLKGKEYTAGELKLVKKYAAAYK